MGIWLLLENEGLERTCCGGEVEVETREKMERRIPAGRNMFLDERDGQE